MDTILAVDFDRSATSVYRANFPGVEVRCADVADEIPSLPYADVVLAGFPCQPHSLAGKRLASADERDGGETFVSAVAKVNPRMFLGENVPGLLTSEDGRYVVALVQKLEAAGYQVEYRVLDAVDYGVPQFRARVFFWGIRNDLYAAGVRHCWPARTHVDPKTRGGMFGDDLPAWVTVGQALGGLIGDQTMKAFPIGKWGVFSSKHPHATMDAPAPTLQCEWIGVQSVGLVEIPGTEMMRNFTPNEGARIQSVPDDFQWAPGISTTAKTRIVGNGMACAMMAALAQAFQRADPQCKTLIDLFCGGGLGATGWHGKFWSQK